MELADFETSSWELVTSCKWRAHLLGAPLGLKFCDSGPLWFFFVWLGVYPMASHIVAFAPGLALSGLARAAPLLCDPSVVGGNGDGALCGESGGGSPRPGMTGHSGAQHHGRGCDRIEVGCGSPWGLGCGGVGFMSAQIRAPQVQALESRGLVPGATALSTTASEAAGGASGGSGFKRTPTMTAPGATEPHAAVVWFLAGLIAHGTRPHTGGGQFAGASCIATCGCGCGD